MRQSSPLGLAVFVPGLLLVLSGLITAAPQIAAIDTVTGGPVPDVYLFWTAGQMTADGRVLDLFSPEALQAAMPEGAGGLAWLYPPTMAMILTPLGLMPFWLAKGVVLSIGLCGLVAAALGVSRATNGGPLTVVLCVFCSATIFLLSLGQLTGLFAALIVWGLTMVRARPVLAGVLLGLLSVKPHIAVLIPFALIGLGAWRTAGTAAITAAVLVIFSLLTLGTAPWATMAYGLLGHQGGHGAGVALGSMGGYHALAKLGLPTVFAFGGYLLLCAAGACGTLLIARRIPQNLLLFVLLATGIVCPVVWPYQWLLPTLGAVMLVSRDDFADPVQCALAALVALGGLPAILTGISAMTLLAAIPTLVLAILALLPAGRVTAGTERPSGAAILA